MIRHRVLVPAAALGLLVLWAPLPFGSVTPAAVAALEAACFVAFALAAATAADLRPLRRAAPVAALLLGLALWGLVQSAPWPAGAVAAVAPEQARLARGAAEALAAGAHGGEALALGSGAPRPALSLAPSASRAAALAWAAIAAALGAAAITGGERQGRRLLAAALGAGALAQVVFGAQAWFARSETIWGVDVPGAATRLRGTFVNPDHAATYLGIALPAAFAWGWWATRRAREEPHLERRVLWLAPPALVWLTLFAGLAFTGSRGGLVAAVTGAGVQGLLLAVRGRSAGRRGWRFAPVGVVAAAVGVGVVAAIGLQEGLGRILATTPYDVSWGARRAAYAATLDLWRRFPWTGSGLGTFREAFPLVQPAGLSGTWRHAHSDPVELLATAGVVGALLLAAALVPLLLRLAQVLQRGHRSEDRAAALAALGALAALAVHEAVDFGLTIPANALTLAVVLGAALGARTEPAR
ncbi:MAG TPA: O-antigen ligase family protein [Thermoanaerobaculia bacterium]